MKSCKLFSDIQMIDLIPLALKTPIIVKKYNEVIINQGEVQTKCYIIISGLCKLVAPYTESISLSPSKYSRDSQKANHNVIRFGLNDFHPNKSDNNNDNERINDILVNDIEYLTKSTIISKESINKN